MLFRQIRRQLAHLPIEFIELINCYVIQFNSIQLGIGLNGREWNGPNNIDGNGREEKGHYIGVVDIVAGAEILAILRIQPLAGIAVPGSAGTNRMEAGGPPLALIPQFG